MKNWKILCFWIALSEAVGITAGILTRKDVQIYSSEIIKPLLSPPPVLFPIVWTILYALMGYGAAKIFITPASKERTRALLLYFLECSYFLTSAGALYSFLYSLSERRFYGCLLLSLLSLECF